MKTLEIVNESTQPYDTQEFATQQNEKDSLRSWIILGCTWVFYLYEYVLRVSPSVMTSQLALDFSATAKEIGVVAAGYYTSYVILQIPCGLIADRIGPKRVVIFSAFLCVIGCVLFSFSTSTSMGWMGRFFMGAGSACAYICCTKVAAEWFNPNRFAVIAGVTMFMGTLGGSSSKIFAYVVNDYGWRYSMIFSAIAGVGVILASLFFMRDYPYGSKSLKNDDNTSNGFIGGLLVVAKNPQNWLIGLYGCMMYLPLSAFAELWGVPYIKQLYQVSDETASNGAVMVFTGMGIGSILGAWYSNKIKSRIKVMSFSAISTLFCFIAVFFTPELPMNTMMLLLFLGGLCSGGQILYFAAVKENSPHHLSATAVGFTNCLVMISGVIFQPLLGMLLDAAWDGQLYQDGTRLYSLHSYQYSFSAVLIALLLSWLLTLFIKETYEKN